MPYGYNGIVGLLVLIADIYAIINVISASTSNGNKVLWIVVIVLLPLIGVILWYFLGPRGRAARI